MTRPRRPKGRVQAELYSFFNLGARWGGWSTPRPGRFTPEKDPAPIVQTAGWVPGPVWTGAENLASTGIRSPDRPDRNESLYRLSYPGPCCAGQNRHEIHCDVDINTSISKSYLLKRSTVLDIFIPVYVCVCYIILAVIIRCNYVCRPIPETARLLGLWV